MEGGGPPPRARPEPPLIHLQRRAGAVPPRGDRRLADAVVHTGGQGTLDCADWGGSVGGPPRGRRADVGAGAGDRSGSRSGVDSPWAGREGPPPCGAGGKGPCLVAQHGLLLFQVVALLTQPHLLLEQRCLLLLHPVPNHVVLDVLCLKGLGHRILCFDCPCRLGLNQPLLGLAVLAHDQLVLLVLALHALLCRSLTRDKVGGGTVMLTFLRSRKVPFGKGKPLRRHLDVPRRLGSSQPSLMLRPLSCGEVGTCPCGVRPLELNLPLLVHQKTLYLPQPLLSCEGLLVLRTETCLSGINLTLGVCVCNLPGPLRLTSRS
eukprot:Sspe_Gene.29345::Locus_13878_Transcript_2_2_Confidence_0.667_Length_2191::g.29345::m.29345